MNDRQRRFCEHYAQNPNATAAAEASGYSKRTAYSQGQRLLKNVECMRYIRQLQDEAAQARMLSVTRVKAYLSDVIVDADERTADRLKAADMYLKAAGEYLHIRPDPDDPGRYAYGATDASDVIIYLPELQRPEDAEMPEEDEKVLQRLRNKAVDLEDDEQEEGENR